METWSSCVGMAMLVLTACSGGGPHGATPSGVTLPPASGASAATLAGPAPSGSVAGAPSASPDAGGKPAGRPFAKTQGEALSLIDTAISDRSSQILACVTAARERRKTPHADIAIDIGIDQEGTLMGVTTAKGQPKDEDFASCMRSALSGANFPRSTAGVITVNKKFGESVVYR